MRDDAGSGDDGSEGVHGQAKPVTMRHMVRPRLGGTLITGTLYNLRKLHYSCPNITDNHT